MSFKISLFFPLLLLFCSACAPKSNLLVKVTPSKIEYFVELEMGKNFTSNVCKANVKFMNVGEVSVQLGRFLVVAKDTNDNELGRTYGSVVHGDLIIQPGKFAVVEGGIFSASESLAVAICEDAKKIDVVWL